MIISPPSHTADYAECVRTGKSIPEIQEERHYSNLPEKDKVKPLAQVDSDIKKLQAELEAAEERRQAALAVQRESVTLRKERDRLGAEVQTISGMVSYTREAIAKTEEEISNNIGSPYYDIRKLALVYHDCEADKQFVKFLEDSLTKKQAKLAEAQEGFESFCKKNGIKL